MLKDEVVIKIQSGRGGNGSMAMYRYKSVGGDGGDGGAVYFKGSESLYDLGKFEKGRSYQAGNGGKGESVNKKGERGKDLYIELPLTTEVYEDDKLLYKIEKHRQEIKILSGGYGELGNKSLDRHKREHDVEEMISSKSKTLKLVLKLESDVIFIGYPNAGKSSLLNELTNRKVKTASYAFTTLDPQIGFLEGLRLMDLPGLIEGTYKGKGVGTKFLKHTENSELVAHFISLENEDPMKTYLKLREEMKKISEELFAKEEIIILSKSDEVEAEDVERVEKLFKKRKLPVVSSSIIDDESIERVKEMIMKFTK